MASSLLVGLLAFVPLLIIACGGKSERVSETPAPTQGPALTPTREADASATAPSPAPPGGNRIQIDPENPRYFSWRGETILPIGATESGPDSCSTANGWLAISSGFDWQPDLENLLAHGGNFARVMPYFPGHPVQPWIEAEEGRYDLTQPNPEWARRLEDYLAWTEANGVVVLLEVFENWSFVNDREGAWRDNPWNAENNVNYDSGLVSKSTERSGAAIYRAFTDNKADVLPLLEQYVTALLDVALPHGNVLYNVSNESNAPLGWSEYWASFIRQHAEARGLSVLVGEMPHAAEPSTGLEAIAGSPAFDFVDAASRTSDDMFGDSEAAEVAGTDDVLTTLRSSTQKPVSIGKIYYRSPATLWSKFINGAATLRYHRNCDRGGSDEQDPQRYFDYVQHLRTFIDELDLSGATSTDDRLIEGLPAGVHGDVLAAPGLWYAVSLYNDADRPAAGVRFSLDLGGREHAARWFDPVTGEWSETRGELIDAAPTARTLFAAPEFDRNLVLLVQVSAR